MQEGEAAERALGSLGMGNSFGLLVVFVMSFVFFYFLELHISLLIFHLAEHPHCFLSLLFSFPQKHTRACVFLDSVSSADNHHCTCAAIDTLAFFFSSKSPRFFFFFVIMIVVRRSMG